MPLLTWQLRQQVRPFLGRKAITTSKDADNWLGSGENQSGQSRRRHGQGKPVQGIRLHPASIQTFPERTPVETRNPDQVRPSCRSRHAACPAARSTRTRSRFPFGALRHGRFL